MPQLEIEVLTRQRNTKRGKIKIPLGTGTYMMFTVLKEEQDLLLAQASGLQTVALANFMGWSLGK